jgi:hypothetical protein
MAAAVASADAEKLWFEQEDGGEVSLVDELKKLSELHTAGVLDDVEFEALKASLLGLDGDGAPAPAPAPAADAAAGARASRLARLDGGAATAPAMEDLDTIEDHGGGGDDEKQARREKKRSKRRKERKERHKEKERQREQQDSSRALVMMEDPLSAEAARVPLHADELVLLPTARLKTLRTEAMIERAVEKVKKSLRTATIDDVGDWLHALGLGHHATTFADHAVDGQLLAELSEEELRDDLGVHKIGDRAKIRRARDGILAGQETSGGPGAPNADSADGIIAPAEEAKKRRKWLGHERIKVQARLSSNDPWINMKISAGELGNDLEQFRDRLASALQVSASALGHLEYMDTNGDWFACINEYDVWDGVAEQGGRALVLQVVESRAPGFQVGETFDHDGRRSLVDVAPGGQGAPVGGMMPDAAMALALDGSLGTGGGGAADRPESTEQLHLFVKALMRRGAVDDAVSELNAWLGARGHEPSEQPYNTLLKLAMDDELPSSVATGILESMEDAGIKPGPRSYQYALRMMVRSGEMQDAADMIRKMEGLGMQPDGSAYEQLVQGLAEREDIDMSLMMATQALKNGTKLGLGTLSYLLNACTRKKAKHQGIKTFELISKSGLGMTQEVYSAVIKCAVASGDLELSGRLLKECLSKRHCPGVMTFNSILQLCAEQNSKQEAVRIFKRLQKAPVDADEDSYKLLLQATAASGDLPLSTKVMQEMVALGYYPTLVSCNQLLALCADQNARTEAIAVFKYMQMSSAAGLAPDAQSYENLIATAVGVNDTNFVVQVLKHMVSAGFAPTAARASELLDVCAQKRGQGAQVLSLYKLLQSIALQAQRLDGDPFPYAALIDCALIYDDIDLATKTLKVALQTRTRVDNGVVGSLVMDRAASNAREALELLRLLVASNKALPSREVIVYFLEQCHRQVLDVATVQDMKLFFSVLRDRGFALEGELKESFHKLKVQILGEDSDEEDNALTAPTKMLLVDSQSTDFRVADFGARAVEVRGCRAVWADPPMVDGPLKNKQAVKGSMVVVARGVVPFVEKVHRVQKAGAIGCIIVNQDDVPLEPAGGVHDREIHIPVICVTKSAGRVFAVSAGCSVELLYSAADAPSPPAVVDNGSDDETETTMSRPDGSSVSSGSSNDSLDDSSTGYGGGTSDASSATGTTTTATSKTAGSNSGGGLGLNSDDSTESQSGSGSESGSDSGSDSDSEEEWVEAFDEKRNRPYYFHRDTNEVRWTKPQ